jgi:hypothetical protein
MLVSELPELSQRYQHLFAEFNARYFGSTLPNYRVLVVYFIDWVALGYTPAAHPSSGFIDRRGRIIKIRVGSGECFMTSVLVHEMAHAATNGWHGPRWTNEILRLYRAGAPVASWDLPASPSEAR